MARRPSLDSSFENRLLNISRRKSGLQETDSQRTSSADPFALRARLVLSVWVLMGSQSKATLAALQCLPEHHGATAYVYLASPRIQYLPSARRVPAVVSREDNGCRTERVDVPGGRRAARCTQHRMVVGSSQTERVRVPRIAFYPIHVAPRLRRERCTQHRMVVGSSQTERVKVPRRPSPSQGCY